MLARWIVFFSVFNHAVAGLQASDFYVHDLPLLPKGASSIRMHAGHLPVNPQHHGALFFWHFANKHVADKPRTVIWLNGGPGCSSLIGAWMEIGPFRFQDEDIIVENDGSWHQFANLLFVDQPVGTGFSYIDKDSFIHELDEMANQFLGFLDRYVEVFPELLQADVYLAGESFAGQYIPYIAQAILGKSPAIKLCGLLIGNGWIDPVTTYESYLPFAVANNLVKNGSVLHSQIDAQVKICQRALSNHVYVLEDACELILDQIQMNGAMNNHHVSHQKGRCVNAYDVRLDDTWPDCGMNWPPDLRYVTPYLHRQDVLSRIHVQGKTSGWMECMDSVFTSFGAHRSRPSIELLPSLLEQIPIVLYSGQYDLICNHWGTEKMIDAMSWNNGTGFYLGNGTWARKVPWNFDGEPAGIYKTARNLTYVLFYNATHMVPYNYARRSRAMLNQFMQVDSIYLDGKKANNTTIGSTDQPPTSSDGTKGKEVLDRAKRRVDKRFGFLALVVIITVMALFGLAWFVLRKRQQARMPTLFDNIRAIRSTDGDIELEQLVEQSSLYDANEALHASGDATWV